MPIILPHELMGYLKTNNVLKNFDMDDVAAYWRHAGKYMSWAKNHWGTTANHLPAFLYGDDAQFDEAHNKLLVVSLGFLLDGRRSSMETHHPLFVLRLSLSCGFDTLQAYMKPESCWVHAESALCLFWVF